MTSMLELREITKSYSNVKVLDGINLSVQKGEMVALIGKSGSGKSTLLQIAGLLERPTHGNILIDGVDYSTSSDSERTKVRRLHIGFIYQFHHLVPELSIIENISLPLCIQGYSRKESAKEAMKLIHNFNLAHKIDLPVWHLSGGEKQRIAIARALVHSPNVILADEPTGNLDDETAMDVILQLKKHIQEKHSSVLLVTHNEKISKLSDRIESIHELDHLNSIYSS